MAQKGPKQVALGCCLLFLWTKKFSFFLFKRPQAPIPVTIAEFHQYTKC